MDEGKELGGRRLRPSLCCAAPRPLVGSLTSALSRRALFFLWQVVLFVLIPGSTPSPRAFLCALL